MSKNKEERFEKVVESDGLDLITSLIFFIMGMTFWYPITFHSGQETLITWLIKFSLMTLNLLFSLGYICNYLDGRKVYWRKMK